MSTRNVTFSPERAAADDYRSLLSTLKITVASDTKGKNPGQNASQEPKFNDAAVRQIKELSSKHLASLKTSFAGIVQERCLSKVDYEQYLSVFHQFQKIILDKRPDAQIVLYGSTLFQCALKETSLIDIDVQFADTLPYQTLKELLQIVRHSEFCKEVQLNTTEEVLSIDLTVANSPIRLRVTSRNLSAIELSRLIDIYIKFDPRVLPLLRLVRIFAQICHLDQRERGTLHPIALHLMVIHFLQQLDPPVLPSLHEYVFGLDKAPVTVINEQYEEFFRLCNESLPRWKSANLSSVPLLFLQFLSYLLRRFSSKRLTMSIKTRMPLLKKTKKPVNHRSIFCADPIFANRNLAYSLKTGQLINYFYNTLKTALNYFCQTPKSPSENANLYYPLRDYDESLLEKQLVDITHKSYRLFIDQFSNRNEFWSSVQQEELRQLYKKTFDPVRNPIPPAILQLKENAIVQLLEGEEEDEEENDEEEEEQEESAPNANEQISEKEEEPVLFNALAEHLNEKQKGKLRQHYDQQARLFNAAMQKICNEIRSETEAEEVPSTEIDLSEIVLSELFYEIQAKNFGAGKNLPRVCSICFRTNHSKDKCPDLHIPPLVHLPQMTKQWGGLVTRVCEQITDECQARKEESDIRDEVVQYLQKEFGKHYPTCSVHVYGSSGNGFALRRSDLDVCIELKDKTEESNVMIFEKLLQSLQLQSEIFKETEFVRDARVPILRSKHSQFDLEIDISLNNILAVENTRLLKTYTRIDGRVSPLGYMIKHLVKICEIADVKAGTLSSYAYILMLIHFLQQIQPAVLPVLQQLSSEAGKTPKMIGEWNVHFYNDLDNLKQVWSHQTAANPLTTGQLWIEFLRYYTEVFDYQNDIVTIRQIEPLRREEKGWFHPTIAIEDPFILTHNLADKLSLKKWALIRRVLVRAREGFALQPNHVDIQRVHPNWIRDYLFDLDFLCPEKSQKFQPFPRKPKTKPKRKENEQPPKSSHNRQQFKPKTP